MPESGTRTPGFLLTNMKRHRDGGVLKFCFYFQCSELSDAIWQVFAPFPGMGVTKCYGAMGRLCRSSVPELRAGGRQISDTAGAMGVQLDENLNPGGPPKTVHPGIVVGAKGTKLTPEAGPQCSALLTSAESSVHLGLGSEFILTMEQETP
jgi:hypothetical protein